MKLLASFDMLCVIVCWQYAQWQYNVGFTAIN